MAHGNNIFDLKVVIVIAYQVLSASELTQSQTSILRWRRGRDSKLLKNSYKTHYYNEKMF